MYWNTTAYFSMQAKKIKQSLKIWYTTKWSFKERIKAAQTKVAKAEELSSEDVHLLSRMELVANRKEEFIELFRTEESLWRPKKVGTNGWH